MRPLLLCFLMLSIAALGSCRSQASLGQLDPIGRPTEARTVLHEDGITLYSPYELEPTRDFFALIQAERDAVFGLFHAQKNPPVLVVLELDEGMGIELTGQAAERRVQGISLAPEGGRVGYSGEDMVVIRVAPLRDLPAPEGGSIQGMLAPETYRQTIRHELAHIISSRSSALRTDWLSEGIAHLVEWSAIEEGRPVLDPAPERLRALGGVPRDERPLRKMLGWKEGSGRATRADLEARLLAFSFVAFFLEAERAGSLREGIVRLESLRDEDVLDLEPEWSSWLEGLAARGRDSSAGDSVLRAGT